MEKLRNIELSQPDNRYKIDTSSAVGCLPVSYRNSSHGRLEPPAVVSQHRGMRVEDAHSSNTQVDARRTLPTCKRHTIRSGQSRERMA